MKNTSTFVDNPEVQIDLIIAGERRRLSGYGTYSNHGSLGEVLAVPLGDPDSGSPELYLSLEQLLATAPVDFRGDPLICVEFDAQTGSVTYQW